MRWHFRHLVALLLLAHLGPLLDVPLRAQQPGPKDMPQEMVWVDRSGEVIERVGAVQNSIFFPEISADGRELFYLLDSETMVSVEVETEGAFSQGEVVGFGTGSCSHRRSLEAF